MDGHVTVAGSGFETDFTRDAAARNAAGDRAACATDRPFRMWSLGERASAAISRASMCTRRTRVTRALSTSERRSVMVEVEMCSHREAVALVEAIA
jgi:hypothetical protein